MIRFLALAFLAAAGCTVAADFPTHPVRIIVPFPPGGGADVVARLVSQRLSEKWGQPVVVDNRPGAGGNVAAEIAASAGADGHTLFQFNVANAIAPSVFRKLNYDPVADFRGITKLASAPLILVGHPELPAANLKALIDHARANPGKLTYASSGTGGSTHLLGELFNTMAQIRIVHVPYKGGAPGLVDVLAGRVDLMFVTPASGLQHIASGRLRAYGISTRERSSLTPGIPTIDEAGVPGFDASAWYGLVVPAKTPATLVDRINRDVRDVLERADTRARFAAEGADTDPQAPAAFDAFLRSEVGRWRSVAKDAGVEPE